MRSHYSKQWEPSSLIHILASSFMIIKQINRMLSISVFYVVFFLTFISEELCSWMALWRVKLWFGTGSVLNMSCWCVNSIEWLTKRESCSSPWDWIHTSTRCCPALTSDAMWRHWSGSTLAQVPSGTNHDLNQCWLPISEVLWYSFLTVCPNILFCIMSLKIFTTSPRG